MTYYRLTVNGVPSLFGNRADAVRYAHRIRHMNPGMLVIVERAQ